MQGNAPAPARAAGCGPREARVRLSGADRPWQQDDEGRKPPGGAPGAEPGWLMPEGDRDGGPAGAEAQGAGTLPAGGRIPICNQDAKHSRVPEEREARLEGRGASSVAFETAACSGFLRHTAFGTNLKAH